MKTLCSYEVYSHPDKFLIQHFKNVAEQTSQIFKDLNFLFKKYDKEILTNIAFFINISHDLAKSTKFFQEYLITRIKQPENNHHHSLLSAIFAFFLTSKYLKSYVCNDDYKILPFMAFLVVKKHHGDFVECFAREFTIDDKKDFSKLQKQIDSINENFANELYNFLLKNFKFENIFSEFKENFNYCLNEIKQIKRLFNKIKDNSIQDFFLLQFLFSLLIDADKLDASGLYESEEFKKILNDIQGFKCCASLVDKHKNTSANLPKASINTIREEIYQQVSDFEFNADNKIYSINVPTGTGKTFASLNFAFKLKEKLDFNPKIIYCLPFTSIIDQNYEVIKKILSPNGGEIPSSILLKHHHLAEISYKFQNENDKNEENENEYDALDTDKSLLLTENWMSSIVVTTFVQFFHSLISSRNKSLKKYHNIANSIVILDEIQAVPYKYWALIRDVLNEFSQVFNTYFVLVTATQPMIFREEEITQVIPNREVYFKNEGLNRITLDTSKLKEDMSLEAFKGLLVEDIQDNPDKSFLIILNTIKSSQDVFNHLQKELKDEKIALRYLSTTILPFERSRIIEEIKNRKDSEKRYVIVSTQVVEAGVDIDLDIVYRDIAPLDCIFQSAGRCNRNGNKKDKGLVKIFKLVNENHNNKPFAEYVYGNNQSTILLDITQNLLTEKECFEEIEVFELAQQYYKKLDPNLPANKRLISIGEGNTIKGCMEKLDFEGIKEFQLIENTQTQDFFIEINSKAIQLKEQFKEIYDNKKGFEKKNALLEFKKEFYQYVVSVRLKKGQKLDFSESRYQVLGGHPIVIPIDEAPTYYKSGGVGLTFDECDKGYDSGIMIV